MELLEKIDSDFINAFKSKQIDKKNFLGVIRGEIQTQKGKGIEPTNENVIKIIKKIEKSLIEVGTEEAKLELTYLEPYLPKMLSEEETKQILMDFVSTESNKNLGTIMKYFNENYKGVVDNKLVQQLSKQII
jgi:uncharacterized protein YqeY